MEYDTNYTRMRTIIDNMRHLLTLWLDKNVIKLRGCFSPWRSCKLEVFKRHDVLPADVISNDDSASQTNNNHNNEEEDDAEYWFDNADPKRPQIEAQNCKSANYSNQQRRIFHKLAPQVEYLIVIHSHTLTKLKSFPDLFCFRLIDFADKGTSLVTSTKENAVTSYPSFQFENWLWHKEVCYFFCLGLQ